jgi:hypothetical protein
MPTTNLLNTWERAARAATAPRPRTPERARPIAKTERKPEGIAALALSPKELESLRQKGLIKAGGVEPEPNEVLTLTRLGHPQEGWSVLLGLVVVSPRLATHWLKNNFGNRPVSEDTVNAYARDAMNGIFLTTHQGIAFNDKDELIDGQHRLLAIQKSGIACTLMVSFGWLSEVRGRELKRMDVIDRGKTRSVADQLKIQHGLKNGTAISQITTQLANLCCSERTRRLSVGQTLDIFRAFEPAVLHVIERRPKEHGLKSMGVMAGFAFALMPEFTGDAKAPFWRGKELTATARRLEALRTGEGLDKGSALSWLRGFLLSDEAKLLARWSDRAMAEVTLNVLNPDAAATVGGKRAATDEGVKFFRALQAERADRIAELFKLPR